MQTGIFRTGFGARLEVKVSSLQARGQGQDPSAAAQAAVVLPVRPEHMQAAVNLKGCDMRLGALCLPDARLGLVLAKSHVDLSIGLFELGHPQAQALVRHALKKGRLPVALEADGQHLFIDTQLTSMARGVFEDSQGRLPAPMAASHRAAAQVIKHLRAFNTAHSYAPEPETLQHIIVSLCTGDA